MCVSNACTESRDGKEGLKSMPTVNNNAITTYESDEYDQRPINNIENHYKDKAHYSASASPNTVEKYFLTP